MITLSFMCCTCYGQHCWGCACWVKQHSQWVPAESSAHPGKPPLDLTGRSAGVGQSPARSPACGERTSGQCLPGWARHCTALLEPSTISCSLHAVRSRSGLFSCNFSLARLVVTGIHVYVHMDMQSMLQLYWNSHQQAATRRNMVQV